jgi:hypothetical protein
MKKPALFLLSSVLLASLASCGGVSASSTSSASSLTPSSSSGETTSESSAVSTTSEGTSTTSEGTSTTSESTTATSTTSVDQGPLTIAAIDDATPLPAYTYSAGVYTFSLQETVVTGVSLSGTLDDGYILIDAGTLTDNAAMELDLNGVTIDSAVSAPIYYTSSNSKLIISAKKGTTNTLAYSGTDNGMAALRSKNNLEIKGKGALSLNGGVGHGIKCDDLTLSSATAIGITHAGNDGIHAKTFDASAFTGSVLMKEVGSQAFDINDYSSKTGVASGAITFPTAGQSTPIDFAINQCANVFQIDNNFTITDSTRIVVTTLSETAAFENVTPNALTITNNGTFSIAGVAQAASIAVAAKA